MDDEMYYKPDPSTIIMDMRQAVFSRAPLSYRVGNSTVHFQTKFVTIVFAIGIVTLFVLFLILPASHIGASNLTSDLWGHTEEHGHFRGYSYNWLSQYNNTYPLSPPVFSDRGYAKYQIAVVSDLDTESKDSKTENTWISYLKKGFLTINLESSEITIEWNDELIPLKSSISYGGRGMELSELIVFNGRLYAVDDRTGIIFEIDLVSNKAIPWVILMDGNGRAEKGFKSEWATVKEGTLIVGGLGKEWTSEEGELVNHNPQWVKTITASGKIENHDWTRNYEVLRESVNIFFPGYMIHEACGWSEHIKNWVFLPRRMSLSQYNEKDDEHRGTNLLLQATEGFEKVKVSRVGDFIETHGFSSFKFIPGTKDELIIALKSEEVDGQLASYVMVFNINGKVLYPETKIGAYKFEGIEFV